MDLTKINSLPGLFFNQFENQKDKNKILLSSLSEAKKNYSWQKTFEFINNLSDQLKKYVNKGDRCLLISENRPEWFISDLSIMLSECITVPAYTTYAEENQVFLHGFDNTVMGEGHWNLNGHKIASEMISEKLCKSKPVSYTHLTLPTILLV